MGILSGAHMGEFRWAPYVVPSWWSEIGRPHFPETSVAVDAEIGGSTVDEATRMMAFLLDHPLSREFYCVCQHGKREFWGSNCLRLYKDH
ncbi:hypothetical protein Q8A67_017008 [Cirrhinus molitorella]|uniref:Uncharacterized protein n=1 Tax=Cirrhinus molitorella TaxID=172907 RepID=A0AA88TII3_9TELE|nr:hypothetical protein Q8A67_017008 [Cirrhinus molitorella]